MYKYSEWGDAVGQWFAPSPHRKKVVGSIPGAADLPVWSLLVLSVSLCVLSGFLPQCKDMHVR